MREIKTQIVIKSDIEKIWQKLSQINVYTFWNPFIIYARGTFEKGKKFSFIIKAPSEKPKFFKAFFNAISKPKEISWIKRSLIPGIFNIEHRITLKPISESETRMEYKQVFSGLLGRWFFNRFEYSYLAGMKKMNKALKEACEQEKG